LKNRVVIKKKFINYKTQILFLNKTKLDYQLDYLNIKYIIFLLASKHGHLEVVKVILEEINKYGK